ncbi:MAG: hypothetical protein OEZ32_02385 [Nitrospinota bacterium]|nr:hypothetical protein [Nitrospinota bacterium]
MRVRFACSFITATFLVTLFSHDAFAAECERPKSSKEAWSATECWIYTQSVKGEIADQNKKEYGLSSDKSRDPEDEKDWPDARLVRPEFLYTILFEEYYSKNIHRKGVRIIGALFKEKVDLSNGRISFIKR